MLYLEEGTTNILTPSVRSCRPEERAGGPAPLGQGLLRPLPRFCCSQTQGSAVQPPEDRLVESVLPAAWQSGLLVRGLFPQELG